MVLAQVAARLVNDAKLNTAGSLSVHAAAIFRAHCLRVKGITLTLSDLWFVRARPGTLLAWALPQSVSDREGRWVCLRNF